jgi:penicillin-binding protein 2
VELQFPGGQRQARLVLKDVQREGRIYRNRSVVSWLGMIVLGALLLTRFFHLQVTQHEHFTTLSESNRLKILPLPPGRGMIYDRNGVILAENRPSYSLEIIPEQVKDLPALITGLRTILSISDGDIARFEKFRVQKRRFDSVPLRLRLNEEEVAAFSVHRHLFPGAEINATLDRHYPLKEHAVHAVGYVGRINEEELKKIDTANYSGTQHIGKIGVEMFYEDELHGKVGLQKVETNVSGRVLRVLERELPTPGNNLYLNLDMGLQIYAEQVLAGERAALVAMDPQTGAVLALVSTPGYDPNLFVNGIDVENYKLLRESPDRPLYNRATRGLYPPGSTVKAFVGLAGLEYGVRSLNQSTWCPGYYRLPGQEHRYRDWKRSGHGQMNFHHAVEQSCDVYFYDLAKDLGIDKLSEFMRRFGFGEKSGIDLDGELGGLMPTQEWKRRVRKQPWYPGETLITGIGQGYMLSTPLQLAVATATLSMRGQARPPRLAFMLDDVEKNEMRPVPEAPLQTISLRLPELWDEAIAAMEAVVHGQRGTAKRIAKGISYHIAGKTGTAQVVGIKQDERYDAKRLDKRFHDHALFIAFAPVEAPRIVVSVIVENGGSGSGTAAPVAKKVIEYYMNGGKTPEPQNDVQVPVRHGDE